MGKKKSYNKFLKDIDELLSQELLRWIYLDNERTNYIISNRGIVYTTNYLGKTGKFKALKVNIHDNGYHSIIMHYKGKEYPASLHRLVAEYFIPNPDGLPTVNHKDGDKSNNDITNLEWMTSKDNSIHAANNGLLPVGEKSRLSRITNDIAISLCKELENNSMSIYELADKYHTTYNTVYDIYRRKSWKQISKDYDFSKFNKDNRFNIGYKITK